jgi:hypothetical protein
MRVDRRDILPTTPQAAHAAAPTAFAVMGLRGSVSLPLAR